MSVGPDIANGRGPAARVGGFMAHLRLNGFQVGPGETELVLRLLAEGNAVDSKAARLGLKTLLTGDRQQWDKFDELFESYWFGRGVKIVSSTGGQATSRRDQRPPKLWDQVLPAGERAPGIGPMEAAGDAEADAGKGAGRIAASRQEAFGNTDLRGLHSPAEAAEAERIAEQLARAIRYRLSRRRLASRRGESIDLRRTIHRSLPRGGEPLELLRRRRPDRPVRILVLLDVSGSMRFYSRYFLSFVRGLVGRWLQTDVFLFHTRLVQVTEALRDKDLARAMDRLALIAGSFDGGTRIAGALKALNDHHAKAVLDSRSVVILLSDGYDTDPPERLATELARLKRRARRLVWLNPLLGWRDYAPVARGMAAALPYIDCFAAANTLQSLAALEAEFARL